MVVFLFGVSISDRNFYSGFFMRCYNQETTSLKGVFALSGKTNNCNEPRKSPSVAIITERKGDNHVEY